MREELLDSNVERKSSIISFSATKIDFISVHVFHKMREAS
jgi:hypothetical protein